ncbi:sigmaY antisigma factor component [Clostridium bovifaecis]|uniref:SigmaY antisigma factor component n=1 Tax=Clostridium bovifaecis TaxID=2184719 RepID=A0A6I6EQF0_9CLOT|nr:sigmaY antisigma factor component [Clostridium bovifaecis]
MTLQKKLFLLIVSPILLIQGLWMFLDARKRGEKYYWLWGIFGLINTPGNLVIYLIVTRIIIDKYGKR